MFRHCVRLSLVAALACGGGSDHVTHPPQVPPPHLISPSVSGPLAGSLATTASSLAGSAPQNALSSQAAALALQAGVQANDVSLTASLRAENPGRAALTSGAAQAFGFQLQVLNLPGSSSPQTFSGVLVFQGPTDWVLVGGPSPAAPIPPAAGTLASGSQLWLASAGQESAQLISEGVACSVSSLPAGVTSCKLATFSNAGFNITAATPQSGGATGSKTASLATGNLGGGVSLIVDCNLGSLCPGSSGGIHVAVTPTPVTMSTNGIQQFAAVVTGTNNVLVTWSVEEANGGTVTSNGRYTAPATAGTYHVRATSQQDPSQYGRATVTVNSGGSVGVTISPHQQSMHTLEHFQFSASVNGLQNTAVVWSVDESPLGNLAGGRITTGGGYTAPSMPGTYHVRATTVGSSGYSDVAVVTVTAGCMEALPPITPKPGARFNSVGQIPVQVDAAGRPLVAWIEDGTPTVAYVARFEAGSWTLLGSSGVQLGSALSVHLEMALDSSGNPVLATGFYNSATATIELHLWGYNAGWSEITTPPSALAGSAFGLALGAGNRPVLAVPRTLASAPFVDLALERWNGSSWVITGGLQATTGQLARNPTLIADAAGNFFVGWEEPSSFNGQPVFVQYVRAVTTGGAGALIAGPGNGHDEYEAVPLLALDGTTGGLVMAWTNFPDLTAAPALGLDVAVYGTGWSQLGSALPGVSGAVVPEQNNGTLPHSLAYNPDTQEMAAATFATVPADVPGTHFAVYEQQGTQAWQLVCAPVQDLRGAQSASVMFAAGMAYDPLGHQFVLALPSGPQMLVARVGH